MQKKKKKLLWAIHFELSKYIFEQNQMLWNITNVYDNWMNEMNVYSISVSSSESMLDT